MQWGNSMKQLLEVPIQLMSHKLCSWGQGGSHPPKRRQYDMDLKMKIQVATNKYGWNIFRAIIKQSNVHHTGSFPPPKNPPRHPQRNKNTDHVILPKLFLTFSSAKVLNNCFPVGYIPIEWPFPQQSSKHCDPPRIAHGCSGVAKQIVCISNPEACKRTYLKISCRAQINLGNQRKCRMN